MNPTDQIGLGARAARAREFSVRPLRSHARSRVLYAVLSRMPARVPRALPGRPDGLCVM